MVFRLYWKQAGDRQNMIIRQLNIKNSGEIHDKTLEFSPGINWHDTGQKKCIYGRTGKYVY